MGSDRAAEKIEQKIRDVRRDIVGEEGRQARLDPLDYEYGVIEGRLVSLRHRLGRLEGELFALEDTWR